MKVLRWSLQLHKWIALVVGVQVLLWVLGGLVMTAIPIERVRSEHHVAARAPEPLMFDVAISPADAARSAGLESVTAAELLSTPRGPVWRLTPVGGEPRTLDAMTGTPMQAIGQEDARALAQAAYKGDGRVVEVRRLDQAPRETGRDGPIWRVDFDDAESTTFYLSIDTGEVVTRRSGLWRFYDFFWRLHVMDWDDGADFNHPLIVSAAALALVAVLTGFVLLWIRLGRDLKMKLAERARLRAS
jgi:uncharacterized iron-regulated membrane protein